MTYHEAILLIYQELGRAETIHPVWPEDAIHAAAIVSEEAGELVQAANDFIYDSGAKDKMQTEAVHTGAMAIRFLINEYRREPKHNPFPLGE